jgi:putative ATP-dependent endonuclease of OLD family
MKITQIEVENFKAFEGKQTIDLNSNIVVLVGENNTGKTSLFSAIEFLKNGPAKDANISDYLNKNASVKIVSVEVTIQGAIKHLIQNFSEPKFLPYIFIDENGNETIRIKRSSEHTEITQNKKSVQLDEKKIRVFNTETNQYENPAGFDKAIGSFFDAQFIWSDMQSDDVVDFGSTKILGRLLKEISGDFQKSKEWKTFLEAHETAFKTGDDALSKKSSDLVNKIEQSLLDFYGKASIQLDFRPPDPDSFIKLGDVSIDDGVTTSVSDKGSGMQRTLALAVIKVYADQMSRHESDASLVKPIFLFIDEPEISLHPRAQSILAKALSSISKSQQVMVTTHSPYILKDLMAIGGCIRIFSKSQTKISVDRAQELKTFTFSPTIAEINYRAYNLPTIEFHNELYGYISEKSQHFLSAKLDGWLNTAHNIPSSHLWVEVKNGQVLSPKNVSLMTFIRHKIHHPENTHNPNFFDAELDQSIQLMLLVINSSTFQVLI